MNITLAFQQLDDIIVSHTKPPVTPMLRNKLHLLRDQVEAYVEEKQKLTADHAEAIAHLKEEHQQAIAAVEKQNAKPKIMGAGWREK